MSLCLPSALDFYHVLLWFFFTTFTDILYLSAVFISSCVLCFCLWSIFFAPSLLFLLRSLNRYVTAEVWKLLINHSQARRLQLGGGHPGEQAACRKTYWYYLFIPNGRCTRVTSGYGTVRCVNSPDELSAKRKFVVLSWPNWSHARLWRQGRTAWC